MLREKKKNCEFVFFSDILFCPHEVLMKKTKEFNIILSVRTVDEFQSNYMRKFVKVSPKTVFICPFY
jgi:hypothetical protein